jgi:hypothetical protein
MAFQRAVGEPAPPIPGIGAAVPPTFPAADPLCDPEHMRGMRPTGALAASSESGGSVLHAEQHFEYVAPIRVGDVLTVVVRDGRSWTKQGRSGQLCFHEIVKEYRDGDGQVRVRSRMVLVTGK